MGEHGFHRRDEQKNNCESIRSASLHILTVPVTSGRHNTVMYTKTMTSNCGARGNIGNGGCNKRTVCQQGQMGACSAEVATHLYYEVLLREHHRAQVRRSEHK